MHTQIIYKVITNFYLRKLGNGQHKNKCLNDVDFYTGVEIKYIPDVYIYCINTTDKHWFGFDIRSLYHYIQKTNNPINPYTMEHLSLNVQQNMQKKINMLKKLGLETNITKNHNHSNFEQKITEVFQKLRNLDFYLEAETFINLDYFALKSLYLLMNELWTKTIKISARQRKAIVQDGLVFAEANKITKMKNNATNLVILRKKIISNLDKLISDGKTLADRKCGAFHFILVFSQIINSLV